MDDVFFFLGGGGATRYSLLDYNRKKIKIGLYRFVEELISITLLADLTCKAMKSVADTSKHNQ